MNETIQKLDYNKITEITQHPVILWGLISIFFFVLIIFLLYGIFGKARTSQGRIVHGVRPIQKLSFWVCWLILWVLPLVLIILFMIFPIWAKMGV
jgi:predicted membrane protein